LVNLFELYDDARTCQRQMNTSSSRTKTSHTAVQALISDMVEKPI